MSKIKYDECGNLVVIDEDGELTKLKVGKAYSSTNTSGETVKIIVKYNRYQIHTFLNDGRIRVDEYVRGQKTRRRFYVYDNI